MSDHNALRHEIYLSSRLLLAALNAVNNQIRVPHSQQPVAITHPNVVLVQNYLALSPKMDEIFQAWKRGSEVSSLYKSGGIICSLRRHAFVS